MGLKEQIYLRLKENKGEYISGQKLAEEFSKTRGAVWKAVKALQAEGYKIDAVTNHGYALLQDCDDVSPKQVTAYLNTPIEIKHYNSIDSTNSEAKRMLAENSGKDFLVLSDEQTAGRGRQGKSFYSPAETGIYMSLVLHPNKALQDVVYATTAAAVAVCCAIEDLTPLSPQIKWVNDIYLGTGKVAGILTEAFTDFETMVVTGVIIGIGININTKDFPGTVENPVSLNVAINKNKLIAEVVNNIYELSRGKGSGYMEYYRQHSMVLGKRIAVTGNGEETNATALSVEDDGALKIRTDAGEIKTLKSGTIRLI